MITRENIIHFLHQIQRKSEDGRSDSGESAEGRRPGGVDRKSEEQIQNDAPAYIENEALLNLYIRPFLDGEASLNEELAREFLHQIRMADDEAMRITLPCWKS